MLLLASSRFFPFEMTSFQIKFESMNFEPMQLMDFSSFAATIHNALATDPDVTETFLFVKKFLLLLLQVL
jgi:hypothetical protein